MKYVLAIDQGTTSSRAILFDKDMRAAAVAQQEFAQHFPAPGLVEHDPEEIWNSVLETCRAAMSQIGCAATDIVSIGITNQRETCVVWDRSTGRPIHNAIVWQDRRTADYCQTLAEQGKGDMVTEKTGLLLDPYFSATKIKWILDNVDGAHQRAEAGELAFGTVDSFLLWRLTSGQVHATDATNASRTMLYNIRSGQWDDDLCDLFDVPRAMLPEVRDCAADFGECDAVVFGAPIPVCGIAGDQQAATIGQACFEPGMMKSTYGTGCFAMLNTGAELVRSNNRLLGTIAYQLDGQVTYALEGSIFMAGAVVQWLRDKLGIISDAKDTAEMATRSDPAEAVYLVPAFTGLGAPYWDTAARGSLLGLTRNSGRDEIVRAALESVGYQTLDLLEAMRADWPLKGTNNLRVDGGMSANDWAMQFLSDITGAPVDRSAILETTAFGAAWLAGMHRGFYPDQAGFAATWQAGKSFTPRMKPEFQRGKIAGWKDAVARVLQQP